MRNNFKYKVSLLTIAAIFFSAMTLSTNTFADSLDITITNRVNFTLPEQDSNNATVSNIQIVNNSDTTSALLTYIGVFPSWSYHLEPFDSAFNTFSANSNHFGVAYNLAAGARDLRNGVTTKETIETNSTKTLAFTGKSSIFTNAIAASDDIHMANIELTLEALMTDYSITWDMDGGTGKSGASYPSTLTPGQKVDLSQIEPTRTDYIFDHWLVTPSGSGDSTEYISDMGSVDLNPGLAQSITVQAVWRRRRVLLYTGNGDVDGAVWYAWTWRTENGNNVDERWVEGYPSTGPQIAFSDLSSNVVFVRMDPTSSNIPSWDWKNTVWNQSLDIIDIQDESAYSVTGWDKNYTPSRMICVPGRIPVYKYSVTLKLNDAAAANHPKWYIHSYGVGVPLGWHAGTYTDDRTVEFNDLGNRVQFVRMDPTTISPCMTATMNDPDCTTLWNKTPMIDIWGSTYEITDFVDCDDDSTMQCIEGEWTGDITYIIE